uniref:Uncharacterized protein n=1 Tax=Arundo donax TaxID=35708 RepID=A0A0A9HLV7_ARUDO
MHATTFDMQYSNTISHMVDVNAFMYLLSSLKRLHILHDCTLFRTWGLVIFFFKEKLGLCFVGRMELMLRF